MEGLDRAESDSAEVNAASPKASGQALGINEE
jgi:hypothetical protein